MDIFDRKIIGWSFSSDMTDENSTVAALKMAVKRRNAILMGCFFIQTQACNTLAVSLSNC
ncbi:hypothetical protein BN938_0182 [Mucinivorans hirudinis]|uniref:Uncharacterized protein n=1 Tax=Mucinivorans hirudinis TaxID=1433126 RepID=A0A060R968_9BACT|nr:hypothetical protein BN938_0182 [Mucinivorans hirudinis]